MQPVNELCREMDNCNQDIDILFEVSWEVCNKVGGIYTVLSSKAKTLKEQFKDKLIFIGPDVWSEDNPSPYFVEVPSLLKKGAGKAMLPDGIDVRIGRWDIPGRPVAVLVKFQGMEKTRDKDYARMWELYGVDSLHAYGDYDEGCDFGRAAAAVIEAFVKASGVEPCHVIAHFDEWTTAMGLLALEADMPGIATVFTTHATSIGRSICGNGKPLYDQLRNYNGDQMAAELNMQSKHSLEKAAAHNADCFTTVSDVTAEECAQLLERRPDVVTPNGFELNFVPGRSKYPAARSAARTKLLQVARALTGVEFEDDTFIIATSGRHEYRNKGIDLFLDSLDELRHRSTGRRTLAYVLVPGWCGGSRPDLTHNLGFELPSRLSDPVITHRLNNYNEDAVNSRIHQLGFANDATSDVMVIYVPCYLDGADGIFNMTYYELLPGLDATVFPSYYEPWGYTPLESIAFGIPTVTTCLAGFGMWIEENFKPGFANCGVEVVGRTDNNYSQSRDAIADAVEALEKESPAATAAVRKAAAATAAKAQWKDFISDYYLTYCEAFSARDKRIKK